MSWLDIMVIIILIVAMIRGYLRGLILTLASMISFILSIVIAGLFYKDITRFLISKTGIIDNISVFNQHSQDHNGLLNINEIHNFPQGAQEFLQNMTNSSNQFLGEGFTQIIFQIIVFFVIVLLVRLLIHWIAHVFDAVSKLPILNFFNKTGGGILGIIEGCIINVVVVSLIYTLALFSNQGIIADTVNNSIIAQVFYLAYIIY